METADAGMAEVGGIDEGNTFIGAIVTADVDIALTIKSIDDLAQALRASQRG